MITYERLRELIIYGPATGLFTWRVARARCIRPGDPAGFVTARGYVRVMIDGRTYQLHRLAFLYMEGRHPTQIDHINGVRYDNRWVNLRECNGSQNQGNTGMQKNNKLGVKGISYKAGKYVASLGKKYLGRHSTIEEAKAAYDKAALEHFGEFARTL